MDELEKERDFYFGKLRDIEVICQEADFAGSEQSDRVLQVLYATEVSKSGFKLGFWASSFTQNLSMWFCFA